MSRVDKGGSSLSSLEGIISLEGIAEGSNDIEGSEAMLHSANDPANLADHGVTSAMVVESEETMLVSRATLVKL